ncbi:MAG: LysR family transcriptional regulator [Mucilaginibacter sp.]|nr:LysR family transcriptional regulator [Mucilaginibacter sp.]
MAKSIKDILIQNLHTRVNGSLWLESDNGRFLGPGPIELLERIAETGSISMAAKEMGMSYKKAWGLINVLNAQMTSPAVIPQTGGEKGGGSTITPEAMELIKYHRLLRERFAEFLEGETKRLKI